MRRILMPHLAVLLAALVIIVSAACNDDGTPSSTPYTAPSTGATGDSTGVPASTTTPATSSGAYAACDVAKPHAAGTSNESLLSGGIERTYLLHVPPGYDGATQTPLVLNLHGYGSGASQQAFYSQLPPKGDQEGFIVVTPDGTGTPRHWNYPGFPGADDIAFIRDLLDRLDADLCIDPGWVFAAGMSNGAALTSFIACAMPDRIVAIAAVGATSYPRTCTTDRAIPVISFRGTADACVPYEGGTSQCGMGLPVQPVADVMSAWATHNGCNPEPERQRFTENTRTVAYSECRDNTAVVLFVIEGGGHTWPGSIDVVRLGATNREINATDQMWEFFVAQAR